MSGKFADHLIWRSNSLAAGLLYTLVLLFPSQSKGEQRTELLLSSFNEGAQLGDAPVQNAHFMPAGNHAAAKHPFEGRLTIISSRSKRRWVGGTRVFDDRRFPPFSVEFITVGDDLVPATRGVIHSPRGTSVWNIILGPGKVWSEPAEGAWSRAAFPFTLTRPSQGATFNGIAAFAYTSTQISNLRFQVVQEARPNYRFDTWGAATATYDAGAITNRNEVMNAFHREVADQITFHPWSELADRYGADLMQTFDGTGIRKDVTLSGLVIDGKAYRTECRTRYGPYPFCRHMRHGVFSVTKSAGAAVALFRLAQKYGDEVLKLRIADYVDVPAKHDGWADVTFVDALNMATGIGSMLPKRVDHFVRTDIGEAASRLFGALSMHGKLRAAGTAKNYPWGPGEVFRYRSADTFVLAVAMDAYLKSREGSDARLWDVLLREVYQPIGIHHLPALHTVETDGTRGIPVMAYGLFPTLEDVVKIVRLLRSGGKANNRQLLHRGSVAAALDGAYRGLPTGWKLSGGEVHYKSSFWVLPHRANAGCVTHIPFMAGYGGNYVMLLDNGITAIRFADGSEQGDTSSTRDNAHMRHVADSIKPLCN